jgi:thiol-disulfide isomerase/thioredoxin
MAARRFPIMYFLTMAIFSGTTRLLILGFSGMLLLSAGAPHRVRDKIIGTPAPDFSLPDRNAGGKTTYTLSRNFLPDSGRAVAVCFFATWCVLCREELILLQKLADSLAPRLRLVAVCLDDGYGDRQAGYVRSLGLACPVVHDQDQRVRKGFGISGKLLPYSVYINKRGRVYTTVSGFSPRAEAFVRQAVAGMLTRN